VAAGSTFGKTNYILYLAQLGSSWGGVTQRDVILIFSFKFKRIPISEETKITGIICQIRLIKEICIYDKSLSENNINEK